MLALLKSRHYFKAFSFSHKMTFAHLEKGVGTVKGGFLRSHSLKFAWHSGQLSGKADKAKIFCSQCSTQMMSAFSDILLGILKKWKDAAAPMQNLFATNHSLRPVLLKVKPQCFEERLEKSSWWIYSNTASHTKSQPAKCQPGNAVGYCIDH